MRAGNGGRGERPAETDPAAPSRAPEQRLGLTWLDKQAATALVDGDATELAELVELARGCAEALAGEDANGARRRLLAREIAMAKATLDLLTASIGDRVRAGDERGALLADRLATSAPGVGSRRRWMSAKDARARAPCTPRRAWRSRPACAARRGTWARCSAGCRARARAPRGTLRVVSPWRDRSSRGSSVLGA
jgi:hypothetical protein